MNSLLRILNVIGLLAVLVINGLAQTKGIAGQTTGEVSARYPTVITPAGYAFSIWLLIYGGLVCFIVYSFTAKGRQDESVKSVGIYFLISCFFNMAWLLLWHLEAIVSSTFIIYALLLSVLVILLNIYYGGPLSKQAAQQTLSKWLVVVPFSLYVSWLCVAALANTAVALTYSSWQPVSADVLAASLLIVVIVLAYVLGFFFKSIAVMLVFVWALLAIAIEQRQQFWTLSLSIAAIIAVSAGIAAIVIQRWNDRKLLARM